MKRILLICDPDSVFIKRYVENVLHPAGWQTVIYPIYGWGGGYREEYARMNVTIYRDEHKPSLWERIPKIRMWTKVSAHAAALKALGPFDAVHCHYLSVVDLALGRMVARQHNASLVATFWGSDLLRTEEAILRRMKPFLEACNAVTVFNTENVKLLEKLYGKAVAAKAVTLDFGAPVLDCIDACNSGEGREGAKAALGVEPGRTTICIGSSASEAQQQLPALQALSALDSETLGKITILLQHTYCHDDPDNEQAVQAFAQSMVPCQTIVLTEFLNDTESATLRCATDIYLHTIRTDSFSDAMKECLYAGAKVAYGSWLSYPAFRELSLPVRSFAGFEELPGLVMEALADSWQPLNDEERQRLAALFKWSSLAPQWMELYHQNQADA